MSPLLYRSYANVSSSNLTSLEQMASQSQLQDGESALPNAQFNWQQPCYHAPLDLADHDVRSTDAAAFSPFTSDGSKQSDILEFSPMNVEDFWLCGLGGSQAFQGPAQSGQENLSSLWTTSPLRSSADQEISSTCPPLTTSPSLQAVTASMSGAAGWISVYDSASETPPSSGQVSGSSQAQSMMHATHYFSNPNAKESPGDNGKAASMTAADPQPQGLSGAEGAPAADSPPAGHGRSRQQAHSKVEKRYRMNINSKIEHLRRILTSDPTADGQSFSCMDESGAPPSRRKSSTELSKGDVLSRAISHLQQLRNEIQHLTSQNVELKEKLALLRSLATDE